MTLALAEPEALPKDGNLRGLTMRTEDKIATFEQQQHIQQPWI